MLLFSSTNHLVYKITENSLKKCASQFPMTQDDLFKMLVLSNQKSKPQNIHFAIKDRQTEDTFDIYIWEAGNNEFLAFLLKKNDLNN